MHIARWKLVVAGIVVVGVIGGLVFALLSDSGSDDPVADSTTTTSGEQPSETTSPDGDTTTTVVGDPDRPSDIESSLQVLGVDTSPSDRVAPDQEPLPDDYSPLGSSREYGDAEEGSSDSSANVPDELLIVGMEIAQNATPISLIEKSGVQIDGDGTINPGTTELLASFAGAEHPWAETYAWHDGSSNDGRSLRSVAAADVDRDGFEEVVVVYVDTTAADRVLRIEIIDDLAAGFAITGDTLGDGDNILDVSIAAGDFNGDGIDQIAVGLSFANRAELRILEGDASSYAFDDTTTQTYDLNFDNPITSIELASGNIDYDNPAELAVIVNEFTRIEGSGPTGASTFYLYDDLDAGLNVIESGPVQGQDGAVLSAVVADLDFGDVDGDGLDELVMGGLAEFQTGCEPYEAFITVMDDAFNGVEEIDADSFNAFFSKCPAFGPWRLRFLHVGTADLDGDGIEEMYANSRVYDNLSQTSDLLLIHELPDDTFLYDEQYSGARFTAASTSITAGDVTGDGRENIIVFAQWKGDIGIFGLSNIDSVGFAQLSTVDVTSFFNTQDRVEPMILPVNVDTDGPLLKYSEGEYELAFTEPVVIAAMAAAPCAEGIGQNLGACSTSFGQGTSETVAAEVTVTVTASVHVGVQSKAEIPLVGVGVQSDFKKTVTATASVSAGGSYTVERSKTFTTGALEDGVVFTTIPYDRYTYTIESHPDPDLVGGTIVVSLPREPIILKVDREFYNENIVESGIAIDERVFQHTIGDISTYPTEGQKNQILSSSGGLENGPISVGQGTGSSGLEIAVSTEISVGGSLGLEYTKSLDVTAGPALFGYSVGYGVEASLTVTSGSQTTYSVEVGDLDAENFAANQYSYGMFTYVQQVGDQEIEVINFWIP